MQKGRRWFLGFLLFFSFGNGVWAQAGSFEIQARSAVLLDASSGQTLLAHNPTARLHPASLTKLMTVYVAYEAMQRGDVRLEDQVVISGRAWKMGGSQIFLKVGDTVAFEALLKGVAIASGNDAALAIAEHLAGFEAAFVARMNTRAEQLGLTDTRFRNPHGLPAEDQHTTAKDMALLALHLIQDHPAARELHSMKEFEYNGITQRNRNRLLWKDPRVDGLKTGWFEEAGYHLVATAVEKERRLIAVVLGAESERSREEIARRLLDYGFKNFHNVRFFAKGDRVKNLPVWKGSDDHLGVVAKGPGIVTVKNGSPNPALSYHLPDKLIAPISAGQNVGEAVITAEGQELTRVELVASQAVPEAHLIKRLFHSLLLIFN
jgi:D-alanyl-D-alanine carboxypeptidase (penicillin-binding protein 5/6)